MAVSLTVTLTDNEADFIKGLLLGQTGRLNAIKLRGLADEAVTRQCIEAVRKMLEAFELGRA